MDQISPLVSVCIPVYNSQYFIEKVIDSVLAQTYENIELIIVDNCSTDNTVQIISRIKPSILIFQQNLHNIGMVGNFNECLKLCNGKYIKFLCADDFLLPNCIESMVSALEQNSRATLVCCGRILVNSLGVHIGKKSFPSHQLLVKGFDAINKCFYGTNYIGEPSAVMFRADSIQRPFNDSYTHLFDLEFWFFLLEMGDLIIISDYHCLISLHQSQGTIHNLKSGIIVKDNILIHNDYFKKTYIKKSFLYLHLRKFRFAYRIYSARKFFELEYRSSLINNYTNNFYYKIISPLIYFLHSHFR